MNPPRSHTKQTGRLLTDKTKLVGPSINCEGAGDPTNDDGDPSASPSRPPWTPHVQSYAVATDAAGLERLVGHSAVFACHQGRLDAIRAAEVGASAAMLAGGLGLDAFQLK